MKKILLSIVALCLATGINAQVVKLYNGTKLVKEYTSSQVDNVIFEKSISDNHEFVDLGLPSGTLWSTCNIGASKPEEAGLFFAWGETIGHAIDTSDGYSFDWSHYKWMENGSDWNFINKYTFPDGQTGGSWYSNKKFIGDRNPKLDIEDDAAYVNWGCNWKMPTRHQFEELIANCAMDMVEVNEVKCYRFTGKNNKKLYFPIVGYRDNNKLINDNNIVFCWASTLYTDFCPYADDISIYNSQVGVSANYRYYGFNIRPVRVAE